MVEVVVDAGRTLDERDEDPLADLEHVLRAIGQHGAGRREIGDAQADMVRRPGSRGPSASNSVSLPRRASEPISVKFASSAMRCMPRYRSQNADDRLAVGDPEGDVIERPRIHANTLSTHRRLPKRQRANRDAGPPPRGGPGALRGYLEERRAVRDHEAALRAPVVLRAVDFFAVERFAVDRLAVERFAVERFAVERFAVAFLAVDFLAVDLRAVVRLAVERLAVERFAVDLRAGARFAVDFLRAVDFFAVVLRAVVFLRAVVDLRAVVFFAPPALRAVVLRAVVLRAVVLRAAVFFLAAAFFFVPDFFAVAFLAVDFFRVAALRVDPERELEREEREVERVTAGTATLRSAISSLNESALGVSDTSPVPLQSSWVM